MTKRELIDRMKAANASGNFGSLPGIVDEWAAEQRARKARGDHYFSLLIEPKTNRIIADLATIPVRSEAK